MSNQLFLFGMIRSGTTLLSRLINTHPEIHCASEPYRAFFTFLRNYIIKEKRISLRETDPFHSCFADSKEYSLYRALQDLPDLELPFPDEQRKPLLKHIHALHKLTGDPVNEPEIMDLLQEIKGETFQEVYNNLLYLVSKVYGGRAVSWVGTKETWITEFSPVLARTYPDARFIFAVRDPRAVFTSINKSYLPKKPWLFLIQQWRKLAMLAWFYANISPFKDRVFLIRFEDLIQKPEENVTSLCRFLGVGLDENMLDPSGFKNSRGETWEQNTSFSEGKQPFDTTAIDRWKSKLNSSEIRFIEELCHEEMQMFHYEPVHQQVDQLSDSTLFSPPQIPLDGLPQWVLDYFDWSSLLDKINELAKETVRKRLLTASKEDLKHIAPEIISGYFLEREIFEALRNE